MYNIHEHDLPFEMIINGGKGGVGKSSVAASLAVVLSEEEKVLYIDNDGGKAGARVLQLPSYEANKISKTHIPNLFFASIQNPVGLITKRAMGAGNFEKYMQQFVSDYGLVALNDMPNDFWGLMTDIEAVHRFITLVNILQQAKADDYKAVVMDVEPTMGLQRLLNSVPRAASSLVNLSEQTTRNKTALGFFASDVKKFLETDYIKKADYYSERLNEIHQMIVNAKFSLVTTPEVDPMDQAIEDVADVVNNVKGQIISLVVNNAGRLDAVPGEEEEVLATGEQRVEAMNAYYSQEYDKQLSELGQQVSSNVKPFREISLKKVLHQSGMRHDRLNTLRKIGKELLS